MTYNTKQTIQHKVTKETILGRNFIVSLLFFQQTIKSISLISPLYNVLHSFSDGSTGRRWNITDPNLALMQKLLADGRNDSSFFTKGKLL